ncbi:MAG: Ig-like domain-containing protein [Gemmatimonadaceae bacterium]|nr:Ig-like domain-containing protein [Gemmatimonadaceae bacterium]
MTAAIGGACTEPLPPSTIASLRIVPQQDSFFTGQTTAGNPFAVTLFDANNGEISDGRTITYTSSMPDIFSVDPRTGAVTGKTTGAGLYRATVSGRFIEASVKIISPVDRVQLNTGDFVLTVGNTRQLVPTLTSPNGSAISGRAINFASSNPAVASVGTGGLVTAVTEGTTTITATSEGKAATVVVTVQRETVASIRLTPQVAQLLRVGGQLQVTAQPLNASGQPLTGRAMTWFTNNPAVVTVSQLGVVSAIGVGNATITVESETRVSTLGITVTEVPPQSVTLEPDNFALATNLTRQLAPIVIDTAGKLVTSLANRQVVWQSSSSIVASVSTSGVVTGTGSGTARISVTVDGLRSNDAVVVVSPQVSSVVLTPFNPQLLRIGTTVQLTAQARDNANQPIPGKTANWSSNNPTIANVSQGGLVSGIAVGSTTITAEIDNRTASVQVTVTLVPVGSVTFAVATDTLVENDVRQYNPVVRDTSGKVITSLIGRQVIFTSNNLPVANVSNQGVVNAVSQGVATIVAVIDGVTSNDLTMRVARVTSVQVTANTTTIAVGGTAQLTVVLRDINNNVLTTSRPISYSPGSGAVASVSAAGIVTGVNNGTQIVTASINGVSGQVTITVQ